MIDESASMYKKKSEQLLCPQHAYVTSVLQRVPLVKGENLAA